MTVGQVAPLDKTSPTRLDVANLFASLKYYGSSGKKLKHDERKAEKKHKKRARKALDRKTRRRNCSD
jgi:hypothetical protein